MSNTISKSLSKYLANYSEIEISQLANFPKEHQFQHALVIPAYQESADFINNFCQSALVKQNVLVVVVLNQPDCDDNIQPQQVLYQQLQQFGKTREISAELTFIALSHSNSALLVVNRYQRPIPAKQGVGLARKIGCDLVCQLIATDIVKSPFIASTDADACLPDNYFTVQQILSANKHSAGCYNFVHYCADKTIHQATQTYETALRYYVAGLTYAKSAYAFFTIGSILIFNVNAYANVRGFPKKSAGEDFYLLNKLAKIGEVALLTDSTITLQARLSDRVPFGTGPAVQKILNLNEQALPYCYYHPAVFDELKMVNQAIVLLAEQLAQCSVNDKLVGVDTWLASLSSVSQQALKNIGFDSFISKHLTDSTTQFNKQWLVWFDAFKTLKFIHALRELTYPDVPLQTALANKSF